MPRGMPISQRWTEGEAFTADVRDGQLQIEVTHRRYALAATA